MTDLTLHHAITQSLRAYREKCERWFALREVLGQELGITESQAREVLGFLEISRIDRTLNDACNQWTAALKVDWAAIRSHMDSAVSARFDATSKLEEATYLLRQRFQCKQSEAQGVLQFLKTAASGGIFRDIALRWVRTFGVDWRPLVAAVIGRENDLPSDLKATQAFGQVLKDLRDQKGISNEELSKRAEIDLEALREIENGLVEPTIVELSRLAKAFDMELSKLVRHFEAAAP
jgi:DNA-binding XRE family transcriptional regulator